MKKFLSVLLIVSLLLGMIVFSVAADEATPEGTAIGSVDELLELEFRAETDTKGKYYLTEDLLITNDWAFFAGKDGTPNGGFEGTLDGNGHTIYFDHAAITGGLFGVLRYGATVKNLNIVQLNGVTYTEKFGGIGALAGSVTQGTVTVENVKVYANIEMKGDEPKPVSLGGLIGEARFTGNLTIRGCVAMGSLTDSVMSGQYNAERSMGGILGKTASGSGDATNLVIEECVNYMNITGVTRMGGIFGYNYYTNTQNDYGVKSITIRNCVNYGTIDSNHLGSDGGGGSVANDSGAAGIVGRRTSHHDDETYLIGNINYGKIIGHGDTQVGGLVGQLQISRNGDETGDVIMEEFLLSVRGNVNYGEIEGDKSAALIPLYRTTTNGWLLGNNAQTPNYHNDEMPDVTLPDEMGPQTIKKFTGKAFTDAETDATLAALNEAFEDVYVKGEDGRIALAWADAAGYTADYADTFVASIPNDIGEDDPIYGETDLTLDATVPARVGGTAISSKADLEAMEADGVYYLTKDIEVKGEYISVQDFAGTLYGEGFSIVFNSVNLDGGLFRNLAGGKVYNLNIVQTPESGSDNEYKGALLSDINLLGIGGVAGYGYGTIVNVNVSCKLGGRVKANATGCVGGIIGAVTGGDTIIYNCKNLDRILGGNAGGIVGAVRGGEYTVEIAKCVNWGEVESQADGGNAGGIIGMQNAASKTLLALENINYGDVSATGANAAAGGIVGLQKNFRGGTAYYLDNLNYGTASVEEESAVAGGIVGYYGWQNSYGAMILSNFDYSETEEMLGFYEDEDAESEENEWTKSMVWNFTAEDIDQDMLDYLDDEENTEFVEADGKIVLIWAEEAEISKTAPEITYTLEKGDEGDDTTEAPETDTNAPAPTTTAPAPTTDAPAPTTDAPTTDAPAPAEAGGCASTVGIGGMIALIVTLGAGAMVTTRRKED